MPQWYGGSALNNDDLIPKDDQWVEQWQRVTRWFNRVQMIREKSVANDLDEYDKDILIAFFQNCFHLSDWIRCSQPNLKDKLDIFFTTNFEMKACRNICDGYKHKELTNPKHPDPDFNWFREYDYLAEMGYSQNPTRYHVAFAFDDDVRKYDLFEFAEKCYRLWEQFISVELGKAPV